MQRLFFFNENCFHKATSFSHQIVHLWVSVLILIYSPKWDVLIKPFPLKALCGICVEEEVERSKMVNDTKETAPRHNRNDAQVDSVTVTVHIRPTQIQIQHRQNPSIENRRRTQSSTTNQEAIDNWYLLG